MQFFLTLLDFIANILEISHIFDSKWLQRKLGMEPSFTDDMVEQAAKRLSGLEPPAIRTSPPCTCKQNPPQQELYKAAVMVLMMLLIGSLLSPNSVVQSADASVSTTLASQPIPTPDVHTTLEVSITPTESLEPEAVVEEPAIPSELADVSKTDSDNNQPIELAEVSKADSDSSQPNPDVVKSVGETIAEGIFAASSQIPEAINRPTLELMMWHSDSPAVEVENDEAEVEVSSNTLTDIVSSIDTIPVQLVNTDSGHDEPSSEPVVRPNKGGKGQSDKGDDKPDSGGSDNSKPDDNGGSGDTGNPGNDKPVGNAGENPSHKG